VEDAAQRGEGGAAATAATPHAQGKGGWEGRLDRVRGSAARTPRPPRAAYLHEASRPLAAHACCGSVQHRRDPARCMGRAAGRGGATG